MFGIDITSPQTLTVAGIAAVWLYTRRQDIASSLASIKNRLFGSAPDIGNLLNSDTDFGVVMECLMELDAYSDKHDLGWGTSLKEMLAQAAALEFDRKADEIQ